MKIKIGKNITTLVFRGVQPCTAKLDRNGLPKSVPFREVKKQIRLGIEVLTTSFSESDGVVRDENELYEIACLLRCLELLDAVPKPDRE